MDKKQLGNTNILVNPIGLGCMGLSHAYGTAVPKTQAIEFIKEAFVYGYNFFDTAESYVGNFADGSISNNEEIIGEAVKEFRDEIVLASKFGVTIKPDGLKTDSTPETIYKSIEDTLKRLQTDYLDLYYQHRIDSNVEAETVATVMSELIDEGKIRAWGISETTEDYLIKANEVCPVTAIQNRYSMLSREHESIFQVCDDLKVSFVAFSPMANGFLTGAYTKDSKFEESDYRSFMPQYSEEGFRAAGKLINLLNDIADKKEASMAQISLSWMISKKDFIIPIPGTTKVKNMKSNFDAGKIKLTQAEVKEIDSLLLDTDVPIFGGSSIKK